MSDEQNQEAGENFDLNTDKFEEEIKEVVEKVSEKANSLEEKMKEKDTEETDYDWEKLMEETETTNKKTTVDGRTEEVINPGAILNYLKEAMQEPVRMKKIEYRTSVAFHMLLTMLTFGTWSFALLCYWIGTELSNADWEEEGLTRKRVVIE